MLRLLDAAIERLKPAVLVTSAADPLSLEALDCARRWGIATGFPRIRAGVLRQMIEELRLPLCNTKWGRGVWPFFLPLVVPHEAGGFHYLGEDWAFSHRLSQLGITPLADIAIRLWHYGPDPYGWEDAGAEPVRYRTSNYHLGGR